MLAARQPLRRPIQAARGAAVKAAPPRMPSAAQRQGNCTTATLRRGRIYIYANIQFERDKPVAIDAELIRQCNIRGMTPEQLRYELEDLFETVTDSDGEKFEKTIFEIKENQPRPPTAAEEREAQRPRRVRQFVDVPQRTPPVQRSGHAGVGRSFRR